MTPTESVVLCEGYTDRAFWAGWLEHLGCVDPGAVSGTQSRRIAPDPWGVPVTRGEYGFRSTGGGFVRVVPCHGKRQVREAARLRLAGRFTKPLRRLVVCEDLDVPARTRIEGDRPLDQAVMCMLRTMGAAFERKGVDYSLDEDATIVSQVYWETFDDEQPGLPVKQTLERLVCAAILAAHPERAAAVRAWLDGRPGAPEAGPKEFAWSHMAGWYAGQGCEAFYRLLWSFAPVAQQLESRLRRCGAWATAEALAR